MARVSGIFTATTVSPRPPSRQCPSCYKIRAGRNLPDKELRYLRTLIVRAAVNRSLGSELPPPEGGFTLPFDLPAPSTCQSLYVVFRTWQRPVFLVNSHLDLFAATTSGSTSEWLHPGWRSFSRSYGTNLPSSLTEVRSSALGFSPRLPVSVYGTDTRNAR